MILGDRVITVYLLDWLLGLRLGYGHPARGRREWEWGGCQWLRRGGDTGPSSQKNDGEYKNKYGCPENNFLVPDGKDYRTETRSIGWIFNIYSSTTVDRFGNMYIGHGVSISFSFLPFGFQKTVGSLDVINGRASESQIKNFLLGWGGRGGINIGFAGYNFATSTSANYGSNEVQTEIGVQWGKTRNEKSSPNCLY